jgi:hypothetical protein
VAAFDSDTDQEVTFDVLNPRQVAALTVIAEPTAIEWRPQPMSGQFSYPAGEPWSVAVVVHNVRPRPRIYWTMNNQSIEGLTVTTTSVTEQGVALTVTETISLKGKEAYNGELLEYRIELEAVDEAGITTVAYRHRDAYFIELRETAASKLWRDLPIEIRLLTEKGAYIYLQTSYSHGQFDRRCCHQAFFADFL